MKVKSLTAKPVDPPVTIHLEMTGDEAFYLWLLTHSSSSGSDNEGLRYRFERGVWEVMEALQAESPVYARAKQVVYRGGGSRMTANRVSAALREARAE